MLNVLDFLTEGTEERKESAEYEAFVDKFKPKKTTDDCYTPPNIYEAVKNWAVKEYGLEGRNVLRPFYPGGDYERYEYNPGDVVIDNPPFSILAKIMDFYADRGIDFFLFAPALTVLSSCRGKHNAIITDSDITYENGAKVRTAFVTNLGDYLVHVSAELHDAIEAAEQIAKAEARVTLPKYCYPDQVLTAATIQKIAKHGQTLRFRREDCAFVRSLDSQKAAGKALFGGGVLLSERAAAERAAAERAAAERAAAERADATRWTLSEREKRIIETLGGA